VEIISLGFKTITWFHHLLPMTYVAQPHLVPLILKNQIYKKILDQHLNHMVCHLLNHWPSLTRFIRFHMGCHLMTRASNYANLLSWCWVCFKLVWWSTPCCPHLSPCGFLKNLDPYWHWCFVISLVVLLGEVWNNDKHHAHMHCNGNMAS